MQDYARRFFLTTLCFLLTALSARASYRAEGRIASDTLIQTHTAQGIDATYSGEYADAVAHMQWVYDYVHRRGLSRYYYTASINLADALYHDGQLVDAATVLRRGLFYCDSLHLEASLKVPFFTTLAQIYTRFGDYKTALRYADDALPNIESSNLLDYASYWNLRGNIYFFMHRYAEAREAFLAALSAAEGTPDMDFTYYVALVNLLDARVHLGEYDGIESALDSCETFYRTQGAEEALHYVYTVRAELSLYRDGDLKATGHYLSLEPTEVQDEPLSIMRRDVLYHYYMQSGQKDSAIAVLLADRAMRDSSLNNVSNMRMADIELQFRESLRENEMHNIQERWERETAFFMSMALALAFLLLFVIYWMRSRSRVRQLRLEQTQDRLMLERLRSTRQRLTPHYLMNLARLLRNSDDHTTEQIAMTLRESLSMGDRIGVTLSEERRFVDAFLGLLSRAEGFRIDWDIAPDVHADEVCIPGMSVQLAVENAVKYAYPADYVGERLVRVSARREVRHGVPGLSLTVEDFGRGFGPHASSTSLGIPILTRTISLLNVHNRHQIDMRIVDKASTAADAADHGVLVAYFFPDGTRFDFGVSELS